MLYSQIMPRPPISTLSIEQRLDLVHEIWDSIATDAQGGLALSKDQMAELDRRWRQHLADPAGGQSWIEVRQELLTSIR